MFLLGLFPPGGVEGYQWGIGACRCCAHHAANLELQSVPGAEPPRHREPPRDAPQPPRAAQLQDPAQGLSRDPRATGRIQHGCPGPGSGVWEAQTICGPHYINPKSLPGPPGPQPSAFKGCAGVWIPAADGRSFTHGLIPVRCRARRDSTGGEPLALSQHPYSKEPNFAGRLAWMHNACL